MATILVELPDHVKERLGIGEKISFENLFITTFGKDFISPDLSFSSYLEMSQKHKEKYDESLQIEKTDLLNV